MYSKLKFLLNKYFFLWVFLCLAFCFGINNFNKFLAKDFQSDSEGLVRAPIIYSLNHNFNSGGYMYYMPIDSNKPKLYLMQFALQYNIISKIAKFIPLNFLNLFFQALRIFLGCILALLLTFYIIFLKKEFNFFVSIFTLICILGSFWIIKFSVNLYWVTFTMFAPFIFSTILYPYCKKKNKLFFFYLIISFLILLKSLCGYEFLTSITLSTFVPIIYFDLKEKVKYSSIIKRLIILFLFCVIGFLIAVFFHLVKGYIFYGNLTDPIKNIIFRANVRSGIKGLSDIKENFNGSILYGIFRAILIYLSDAALYFTSQFDLILMTILIFFTESLFENKNKMKFIFIILFSSFLSSISWFVFGLGHSVIHTHLDSIIFYLPLNLVLYPYLAYGSQNIYYKLKNS